jgi:hypothetical protein
MAVAHNLVTASLVLLLLVLSHMLGDCALDGRLQHLTGTVANQLIEHTSDRYGRIAGTGSAITLSCLMTHPFRPC